MDEATPSGRSVPRAERLSGIVGRSPAIRSVLQEARAIAPSSLPILILGETGTGKELLARAIHVESGRASFLPVNVAAISEHLVSSELFGHARGAFTGADQDRSGLFEAAEGGTLFLDEIGEASRELTGRSQAVKARHSRMHTGATLPVRATVLVAVFALFGCDAPSGRDYEREERLSTVSIDTIDGTPIVRNGPTGLWRPEERWELEESWRVGDRIDDDASKLFGMLTVLTIGPQGHTVALDFQAQAAKVFDRQGRSVATIGGPGQGPGEFDGPLAMAWDAHDRLWIADAWNGRYSIHDVTGALLKTTRRSLRRGSPSGGWRQWMVFVGDDGHFLEEAAWRSGDERSLSFVTVDTTGAVVDTAPPLPNPPTVGSATGLSPERLLALGPSLRRLRAFRPRRVFAIGRDGSIWFGRSDTLRLHKRTLDGHTLRIIETQHRPTALTAAERSEIGQELFGTGLSRSDLGMGRQILQSLIVLDDGHVLAQIEERSGEPGNLFDVFDPEGRFLGSLRFPFPVEGSVIPAVQGDTLAVVGRGDLDVQFLARVVIRRPAS